METHPDKDAVIQTLDTRFHFKPCQLLKMPVFWSTGELYCMYTYLSGVLAVILSHLLAGLLADDVEDTVFKSLLVFR